MKVTNTHCAIRARIWLFQGSQQELLNSNMIVTCAALEGAN